jgi:hypothetical protein
MARDPEKVTLSIFLSFSTFLLLSFLLVRQNLIILPLFAILVILICCFTLGLSGNLYFLTIFLLTSIVFQALFASLAVSKLESFERISVLLFEFKSFILIGATCGLFVNSNIRRKILSNEKVLPFLLIAWACIRGIITRGDMATTLAYLRNFSSLALILAIGIAATQTITEEKWEIILSTFTLFLLLGVVLEIAFGRDAWWSLLNLDKLESIKGPYSTTTDFFGFTVLRLRTFVGEPINTSYMFGALAAWHFYKRKIAMALILSVTLFFTFAKSGIILLLMSLAWYHLCTKKRIKKVYWFTIGAMITPIPLFALYVNASDSVNVLDFAKDPLSFFLGNNTAFTHASGLILGVKAAFTNPLGSGLGVGGNFGEIFTNTNRQDWISSGSESGIGVIGFQLGLPGLLLVLAFVFKILSKNLELTTSLARATPEMHRKTFGASILIGWFSASLFSENAFGPQSAIIPMLCFAYYYYWEGDSIPKWEK